MVIIGIFLIDNTKIEIQYNEKTQESEIILDSLELNVYLENSGSMDAYMCDGSQLKDAVYDYVSKLSRLIKRDIKLNYVNSQIIEHHGDLQSYIKNMNPQSFKIAGGNRSNTDLPNIIKLILERQKSNSVTIFISDCILDVPNDAKFFFGLCRIAIRNAVVSALDSIPTLGVEVLKLESNYNGLYFYSSGSELLENVTRPYYMWIIGDRNILAKINKKESYFNIMHGVKDVCAFTRAHKVDYRMQFSSGLTTSSIPSSNKLNVQLYVDMSTTLQNSHLTVEASSDASLMNIKPIQKINGNEKYTHVMEIEMLNPLKLSTEKIEFKRPYIPKWVQQSNDETGLDVKNNLNKTTGIKYIIQGVADAYKDEEVYTTCEFNILKK